MTLIEDFMIWNAIEFLLVDSTTVTDLSAVSEQCQEELCELQQDESKKTLQE